MLVRDLDLYPWADVYPHIQNPFANISTMLTALGFDTSEQGLDSLNNDFNWCYADAMSFFTAQSDIDRIFKMILLNSEKYFVAQKMYTATKTETRIREPDLTTTTHGSANGTSKIERKQTETQTTTPNAYKRTQTHKVNPYDNPGLQTATEDEIAESGTRTVSTSYTGSPDETKTTSSANSSTSETGDETTTITTIGSDGKTLQEQIDGIEATKTVWELIKSDIAKKLFDQVWRY